MLNDVKMSREMRNMGRKRKNANYRRYYKDYFGIEFGPDMAIHHIDFDRSNNDIENLLLMPKELHAKYHMSISQLGGAHSGMIDPDMRISGNTYRTSALRRLADVFDEVMDWLQIKNTMMRMKYSGVTWSEITGTKEVTSGTSV
jgi:hypothetical protein